MEPVQPEASVVQADFGIKYIGSHAYAFSGNILTAATYQWD